MGTTNKKGNNGREEGERNKTCENLKVDIRAEDVVLVRR
jgi:hypothetical protein